MKALSNHRHRVLTSGVAPIICVTEHVLLAAFVDVLQLLPVLSTLARSTAYLGTYPQFAGSRSQQLGTHLGLSNAWQQCTPGEQV